MSNMIKAYSVRYKEDQKVVNVDERAEKLNRIRELLFAGQNAATSNAEGFIGGIDAIALEEAPEQEQEMQLFSAEDGDASAEVAIPASNQGMQHSISPEEKQALIEAERISLRIEMEKELRTQADIIIAQARQQAAVVIEKAKEEASAEVNALFEKAQQEGYASGVAKLNEERAALEAQYKAKECLCQEQIEQKEKDLEPKATQVVIGLVSALTGVVLEQNRGVVSYLVTKALGEAERSNNFLIRVATEDYEAVKADTEKFHSLFEREVTIEVVQDTVMKRGECMIETDYNIIDCSLGTQLEGLLSDLQLLSL